MIGNKRRQQQEKLDNTKAYVTNLANSAGCLTASESNLSPTEQELLDEGTWEEITQELNFRLTHHRQHENFVYAAQNRILEALNSKRR